MKEPVLIRFIRAKSCLANQYPWNHIGTSWYVQAVTTDASLLYIAESISKICIIGRELPWQNSLKLAFFSLLKDQKKCGLGGH